MFLIRNHFAFNFFNKNVDSTFFVEMRFAPTIPINNVGGWVPVFKSRQSKY